MYGFKINEVYVPLGIDNSAGIERYAPLWQDGIDKGELSLPIDVPITKALQAATGHLDFDKINLVDTPLIYDVAIVDGGFSRYHGTIKFIGRKGNRMQCTLKIGSSVLNTFLKETKLAELDLGVVVLNENTAEKFVEFELHQPGTGGDANTGSFGIGVNGSFNGVPFNTDLATTIADFIIDYNTNFSAINGNTATAVGMARIRFTANEVGASWPFDYTDSIADAEVPENAIDTCTLTLEDAFDPEEYAADNAQGAYNYTYGDATKIVFPVIYNPLFASDADDLPAGDYGRVLNYQEAGETTFAHNDGSTSFWKYQLVPLVRLKYVLQTMYAEQDYVCGGNFMTDDETPWLIIYNNKAIDSIYPIGDGTTSFDVFKNEVTISEHVPDLTCEDLLDRLRRRWNLHIKTDDTLKTVTLTLGDSIMRASAQVDYTHALEDTHEFDLPTVTGLTLKLGTDSDDPLYDQLIRSTIGHTILPQVVSKADLPELASPGDLCYVKRLNQYFIYRAVTTWGLFSELQDDFVVDDGSTVVDCEIGTLFTWQGPDVIDSGREWIVPYSWQKGKTQNPDAESNDGSYELRLLFFRGAVNDSNADPYFLAQGGNYDLTENTYERCMQFNTDYGGYKKDWRNRYKFLKGARLHYVDCIMSMSEQLLFDDTQWIFARGKKYLAKRVTMPLPFGQRVVMELLQSNGDFVADPEYILTEGEDVLMTEDGEGLLVE